MAWRQTIVDNLHPGDIVFRRGVGAVADTVAVASTISSAGQARWTHVGIVARPTDGGPLYVIHAIDDRGVVADPPERFFSPAEASAGEVVRFEGGKQAAMIAIGFVGRPFDGALSLTDEEHLYCSELIFMSMKRAGISLNVPLRKLPLVNELVMLPEDLHGALLQASPASF